jgi:hypothetical protein
MFDAVIAVAYWQVLPPGYSPAPLIGYPEFT